LKKDRQYNGQKKKEKKTNNDTPLWNISFTNDHGYIPFIVITTRLFPQESEILSINMDKSATPKWLFFCFSTFTPCCGSEEFPGCKLIDW
jgi:hypothetical protein